MRICWTERRFYGKDEASPSGCLRLLIPGHCHCCGRPCLSLLTFFAFVFIPFAQQMRVHALQFVLCLMLVILTPLSLCIHSIIDKNIIEKHMVYIFTNYRAISQTPREIRSMLITPATPIGWRFCRMAMRFSISAMRARQMLI